MLDPPPVHRRLVMIVAAGVMLAVLIGIGIQGLTVGAPAVPTRARTSTDAAARPTPETVPSAPAKTIPPPGDTLSVLPHTDDPIVYAWAVAKMLLAWDTMAVPTPADHAQRILDDADPAGLETPALAADIAGYMPTIETWEQLRQHETVQAATIHTAQIPASWNDVAASPAGTRHLRAGTVAVTIEATRHRAGVWLDEPLAADHPTAFTVFLACPPAFERCHTLRLSRLGEPLP